MTVRNKAVMFSLTAIHLIPCVSLSFESNIALPESVIRTVSLSHNYPQKRGIIQDFFCVCTLDKIFLKYLLSYRKTFHHSATQKKKVEEFTKRNNCYYQIWLSLKIKANKNPKQTKIIHMKCHLFNFSESSTLSIQENLSSQICSSFHR